MTRLHGSMQCSYLAAQRFCTEKSRCASKTLCKNAAKTFMIHVCAVCVLCMSGIMSRYSNSSPKRIVWLDFSGNQQFYKGNVNDFSSDSPLDALI